MHGSLQQTASFVEQDYSQIVYSVWVSKSLYQYILLFK